MLTLSALLLLPVLLLLAVVEPEPRVGVRPAPDGAAAGQARDVAERLRTLMNDGDVAAGLAATEAEMNAVLASASRLVPGLRGEARVGAEALTVDASLGAPLLPSGIWTNLRLGFAASDHGFEIAEARLGRLALPPSLVERGLAFALDRVLGPGAGAAAVASVAALDLSPGRAHVAFATDANGRVPLLEALRLRARGVAGTDARALAMAQLWSLQTGVREGRLPREGSFVPYLRYVVDVAQRQEGPERERARGALYALALYCGDPAFETVVGVYLPSRMQGRRNGCAGTTLAGRDDLRKHFVISAGLDAATSSSAAFGMGELKELIDTTDGGSGFSFDDMTADAAGVRFARTFVAAAPADWAALGARIADDAAVLPAIDDLPSGLSAEDFARRYGDVDSDAYAALVAEIDRRVEALPLHAARF